MIEFSENQHHLIRPRRLRYHPSVRALVAEHHLHADDLIWPVFVQEGQARKTAIATLPDVYRFSIDLLISEVQRASTLGIKAIALFPVVEAAQKSADANEALNADNLVCRAIAALKKAVPDMCIIADVALDPYTSHGHDGLLDSKGDVDNDATVLLLAKQAVILAQAGADIVAPSDMMDGRVRAIRKALDAAALTHIPILSYAAKYASAFYGPFRDAVGSKSALGKADKQTYQMQPANAREALREIALDIEEGADMVMVKPALHYLDIIYRVSQATDIPLFVYQVSGEYAMIKLASQQGAIDGEAAMMEALIACKRAGATAILTYAACDIAEKLQRAE